jgi:putative ATP-dependent endonuclease of OLD family
MDLQVRLSYFGIENYRSIAKAQFRDLSNVTMLIGPNNEGKSNVLEALNSCLKLLAEGYVFPSSTNETVRIRYGHPKSYEWESDYPISRQAKNPDGHSIFELHFTLTNDEQNEFLKQTGSRLNDVLPIQLKFGPSRFASFKVLKQGKGGTTLSRKAGADQSVCVGESGLRVHTRNSHRCHVDGCGERDRNT